MTSAETWIQGSKLDNKDAKILKRAYTKARV